MKNLTKNMKRWFDMEKIIIATMESIKKIMEDGKITKQDIPEIMRLSVLLGEYVIGIFTGKK